MAAFLAESEEGFSCPQSMPFTHLCQRRRQWSVQSIACGAEEDHGESRCGVKDGGGYGVQNIGRSVLPNGGSGLSPPSRCPEPHIKGQDRKPGSDAHLTGEIAIAARRSRLAGDAKLRSSRDRPSSLRALMISLRPNRASYFELCGGDG